MAKQKNHPSDKDNHSAAEQQLRSEITERKRIEEKLRQQESLYRAVVENTFFGFTLIDCDYTIVLANNMESRLFRKPVSELIGKKCFREFEKRDAACPHCPGTRAMATGRPAEVETEGVIDDGSHFSACIQAFPVIQQDGAITGFIEIVEDITERKKAEEKLKQYQFMVESAHDAIFFKDLESRYIIANDRALEALGLPRQQVVGKDDYEILVNGAEAKRNIEDDKIVFKTGKPIEITKSMTGADGKQRWFQAIKVPQFDDKGRIIGLVGIARDISDCKRAEEALRETTQTLEAVIQASPLPIFAMDRERIVKTWNPAAERTFGWSAQEVIGRKYPAIPEEKMDEADALFSRALESGLSEVETIRQRKDGSLINVSISVASLRDSRGNINGVMAVITDITERKKAENALRESEEKYRVLVENSPNLVAIYQEGTLKYVNKIMCEKLGWTFQEMTSSSFNPVEKIIPQRFQSLVKDNIAKKLRGENVPPYEVSIKTRDGSEIPVIVQGQGILYHGKPADEVIHIDITKRKKAEQALRDSQALYISLVENLQQCIFRKDLEGRFTFGNKRFCDTLDRPLDEIIGKTDFDFYPAQLAEKYRRDDQNVIETGEVFDTVEEHQLSDGKKIYVQVVKTPLYDSAGKVIGTQGIFWDITERKKAEQALKREKDKAQTYLDVAAVMIVAIDSEGRVGLINNKGCQILGYTEDEILGKNWFNNFLPESIRGDVKEIFNKALAGDVDGPEYYENPVLTKNGDERLIAWHNTILRDDKSNIIAALISGLDITEQRKAEKALIDSEEKYKILTESSLTGIFIQQDGKFVFVNNRFAEMHGYKPKELLGKDFLTLIHPDERQKVEQIRSGRLKGREVPVRYEIRRLKKDGQVIWCEMMASRIEYLGRPAIMGNVVNTTERKKAEQDLRAANQQLRASEQQLKAANQQLQAGEQQLKAANQQLQASEQQLKAANQQLQASEQQLKAANQQLQASEQQLKASNQQLQATNQQLKASQEEIRALAKFPSEDPNPVLRIAKDGTVIYSNQAGLVLLTIWRTEPGKRLPDKWRKFIANVLKAGLVKDAEFEYDSRMLSLTFAPVVDANYVNVYGLDITERKQAEEKLIDYQAQLKSLASQLTLAEESERHRIATELHATIGQSLVIFKMRLDDLRSSTPSKELARTLAEVCELLGYTIQETRTLTFDLSSPVLYELGFEKAVAEWLSERVEKKHYIASEFKDDGQEKPLDDDIRVFLFRDMRELLFNVIKHAQAKRVKVSILKVDDKIHVTVEDDGLGFDPVKVADMAVRTGAFGLFSIRQRLEFLGGHLKIESAPGHGTKITMVAPLKREKTTEEKYQ